MRVLHTVVESDAMTERLAKPVAPNGSTLRRIHADGCLRVGICLDAAGFSSIDSRTGKVSGLDVTFARKVAQAVFGGTVFNVSQLVEFVPISMGRREQALIEGDVDVVISSFAATPERRKLVDFTDPYYGTSLTPIVRSETAIDSLDDLQDAPLVVVENTTGAEFVKRLDLGSKVLEVESVLAMVDTVRDGTALAGFSAAPILDELVRVSGNELSCPPLMLESIAFAVGVRKGDESFRDFLNLRVNDLVSGGFVALAEACRIRGRY